MSAKNVAPLALTPEAHAKLLKVRNDAADKMPLRPDLAIVASALIMAAAELPELTELIRQYGAKVYSGQAG